VEKNKRREERIKRYLRSKESINNNVIRRKVGLNKRKGNV
jgi:hypothetical protein